jgi:hypothetical protein
MALLPISLIFIFALWALGFMMMEARSMLKAMVSFACFLLPITILTSPLEYVTDITGTLAQSTLSLTTNTKAYWVLIDVFFWIISLMNLWLIVTGKKTKDED